MSSEGSANKMEVVDVTTTPVASKTVLFTGLSCANSFVRYQSEAKNSGPCLRACVFNRKSYLSFSTFFYLIDISKTISYISRGVELNQPRLIQRAIRQVQYAIFKKLGILPSRLL